MIEQVKILGHTYKIIECLLENDLGQCDFVNCTIKIHQEQSETQKQDTLLHEIIEALNYHLELKLKHRNISALSSALHQVFVDNSDMFKY